jgi:two-component system response regulator ParR
MTGQDDRETELTGLKAGADDYLTKPVDPEVLLARLDAVRRRHGGLAAVGAPLADGPAEGLELPPAGPDGVGWPVWGQRA